MKPRRISKVFARPLREINREVSDFKLVGRRKYYTVYDAKAVWQRDFGRCYYCGIVLSPSNSDLNTGKFTHRVPIKLGGKIHRDNLIAVCLEHKKNKDKRRPLPNIKISGYNALSDTIVQLVRATIANDRYRISYFKQLFDIELKDIVESKYYPLDSIKTLEAVPKQSVSLYIESIAKELAQELEIIAQSKTYEISRK